MNWKKISLIIIVFLSFIGTGLMLSNVQARQANQLIDAHGMSNNTRSFHINENIKISDFLKELSQNNSQSKIIIHFDNLKNKQQVLIWSNYKVPSMPVKKGRYFTKEDFTGVVSLAILGQDYDKNILETQNNRYLMVNNKYYSVIGELNTNNQNIKNKYYLSTGINQRTADASLKNYQIIMDSSKKSILKKIVKKYHVSPKIPAFVKRHQYLRLSIFWEFFLILIFWLIAIIANCLIAIMQAKQVRLTNLSGKLLRNWILNRSMRIILGQLLLVVFADFILNWSLFISKPQHLFLLLAANYLLAISAYVVTWIIIKIKDKNNA